MITGGWCVAKKRNILRTEKKKKREKRGKKKKKKVPSTGIELADVDWIV